jgi:hypothetical protein
MPPVDKKPKKAKKAKASKKAKKEGKRPRASYGSRGNKGSLLGSESHVFLRSMLNTMNGLPAALDRHVDERFDRLEKRAAEREFKMDEARRAIAQSMIYEPTPGPPSDISMGSVPQTPRSVGTSSASTPPDPPTSPPGRQTPPDTPMSPPPQSSNPLVSRLRNAIRYTPPSRITIRTHAFIPVPAARPETRDTGTSYRGTGMRRRRDPDEPDPNPSFTGLQVYADSFN